MGSQVVLLEDITPARAEKIYRKAKEYAEGPIPQLNKAEAGMRVARAKEPRFMKTLAALVECLDAMAEEQTGRSRREMRQRFGLTKMPTIVVAFTRALECADAGRPEPSLSYLYGAVAEYAGVIV